MTKRGIRTKEVEEPLFDVQDIREQAEDFFDQNRNVITYGGGGLLAVIIGVWAFFNFYQTPREREAIAQMRQAEYFFEQDSFSKALTDPGSGFPGFIEITEKYGNTKAANLANYYAGVSYLHLGRFDVALDYLKDFDAKGKVSPAMKNGLIGDVYSELNNFGEAVNFYKKAAKASGDDFTAPYFLMKAAMLLEKQEKYKDALAVFSQIQKEYPNTQQGKAVEKYIARINATIEK